MRLNEDGVYNAAANVYLRSRRAHITPFHQLPPDVRRDYVDDARAALEGYFTVIYDEALDPTIQGF